MLVHQRAELARVALFERPPTARAEVLDVMKVLEHGRIQIFGTLLLIAQQRSSRARKAGEKEKEVVLEIEERVHADRQRARLDAAVGMKIEAGDAAVRRDVLVLFADRLAQALDLDLASHTRHFARV